MSQVGCFEVEANYQPSKSNLSKRGQYFLNSKVTTRFLRKVLEKFKNLQVTTRFSSFLQEFQKITNIIVEEKAFMWKLNEESRYLQNTTKCKENFNILTKKTDNLRK